MAKLKTVFFCKECGAESAKWVGRCPSCNNWNTYVEETIAPVKKGQKMYADNDAANPISIQDIQFTATGRILSGMEELDRLLGGGFVPGSLVLLGGEPGIGKSTLALQVALAGNIKVLYVSGEESPEQIKLRAKRLNSKNAECMVYSNVNLEQVVDQFRKLRPGLMFIDSIQTLQTDIIDASPGSLTQIRECTARLLKLAKTSQVPVILIGHITKDGTLAGPKLLEHIVDTVLQFEGDNQHVYRVLRSLKNRFGSTAELAIFEMEADGLHEVKNPSEIFLSRHSEPASGVAIASTIDGTRPFLIEIQSLVSSAVYGTPQRIATGFDGRRLNMLLAVLERKAGFNLQAKDVFLNIAGGLRVQDPATDLAVACAVLSSTFDRPVDNSLCLAAEVSLTGELKQVNRLEQRIAEASRLGFSKIIVPKIKKEIANTGRIQVIQCLSITEATRIVFNKESSM